MGAKMEFQDVFAHILETRPMEQTLEMDDTIPFRRIDQDNASNAIRLMFLLQMLP